MQIQDLVVTLDKMTDEELLIHVRGMRHRREILRPARAKIIEKAEKKVSKAKVKKLDGLLEAMSEEDRLKLMALLQQG